MLEQNLEDHLAGIDKERWKWFLDYRNDPYPKENALNRLKQLYTHIDGSKILARRKEEKNYNGGILVEEYYGPNYTKNVMAPIHPKVKRIGIGEIKQRDESTRILFENDSLTQALGKEHSGRIRGIGFGPTPSQLFCLSLQPPVDGAQTEEAQRMLVELQAEMPTEKLRRKAVKEIAAEKLKRKVVEDGVAIEKLKRKAVENNVAAEKIKRGGNRECSKLFDSTARWGVATRHRCMCMNSLDEHSGK
ncbi:uncharacterized protein LOC107484283 [Arachis duranensis]|uniref:Uncharacterized protein n=2 Tax=Arachis TaxID=3817 RepID=A0A444WQG1_ARAHY|nr:uncharacterized protein LOC107484283 [Arachis duranensis]XP_025692652.1 uncharacterized protein LOC112794898 [Arachis hypogaea]RYQ79654.1 hypothetical protein Ahy_Scaffold2g107609 [Arachis hypogaea]